MRPAKALFFLLIIFFLTSGCRSHLPKEVVDLSTTVGEDMKAMHQSYRALIKTHFNSLRLHAENYIKHRWLPVFIDDFIKKTNLVQMIRTTVPDQQQGVNQKVTDWVTVAMETTAKKRRELMTPINEEEKKLLEMVDNSFNLLLKANDKISSHLKSHSKIKEQSGLDLNIFDLKGLREKINKGLDSATKRVTGSLEQKEKEEKPNSPGNR